MNRTGKLRRFAGAALAAWLGLVMAAPGAASGQTAVDLELVLAIDCSYSVDAGEFELQKKGLALAFQNPKILQKIREGPLGMIAITVVEWSSAQSQIIAVPWTLVYDEASSLNLAYRIAAIPRLTAEGGTSISAMIEIGVAMLDNNNFVGERRVIDISADGYNNHGYPLDLMTRHAERNNVNINGLAITHEHEQLDVYFQHHLITGVGAFVVTANGYGKYAEAIDRKLMREIGGSPLW